MPPLIRATISECRSQAGSRAFLLALVLILPCAAFLIGLDAAYIYARIDGEMLPWQLNLSEEGALAEWFEYALTLGAAVWMYQLWRRERAPAFAAAAATFLWLTLDNALALHEAAGAALAPLLEGIAGERAADLGELIVFAVAAAAIVVLLSAAIRASAPGAAARVLCVMVPIAVGAGFGVAMDFVSHIVADAQAARLGFDFVEDSGELAMLCLAAACATAVRFNAVASRPAELPRQPAVA
ncbi:hypothetical protein [Sphingosinicella sp. YJ22]|uniref:hypothetical protein n=1 Tax=Sphingosinicella sp. YJ22 TaxID=1104780 RepID=UPI00140C74AF|nr:hypothetical protein [Sphingosinicella sp. YJ22]